MKKGRTQAKNVPQATPDEILPEYDFSQSRTNRYAARYRAGSSVVVLDPDVAAAFPTGRAVNRALRRLAGLTRKGRSRKTA